MSYQAAEVEHRCYFCPLPIEEGQQYVEWVECYNCRENPTAEGVHRQRLHPKCATMLAARLIGDAFSAKPNIGTVENLLMLVESRAKFRVEFKKSIASIIKEVAIDDLCRCAYLTGSIKDGLILVEDIYIPKQTPSVGATRVEIKDDIAARIAIRDQGAEILGEVLSHGSMSAFESGTSRIGRKKLSQSLNRSTILLVVNTRGQHQLFQ